MFRGEFFDFGIRRCCLAPAAKHLTKHPTKPTAARVPPVVMPHITIALIRKRSEHNEGMISSLEELALHQEELETLDECLGQTCRFLKILLLQNNIISKMENLHHMKDLEYLNLALNNITIIEGLDRCEFLNKLDLTINFIDVDTLESSIDALVDRPHLADLYFMGNPCEQEWPGFKPYVYARLPNLKTLDGTDITRAMRITAEQQLPALVFDLRKRAAERSEKRIVEAAEKEAEKEKEREEKEAKAQGKADKARRKEEALASKIVVEECGESSDDDDDEEEDKKDELTSHCPEVRTEMYREMAEQKKEKDDREKEMQPKKRGEKEFEEEQKAGIAKAREREERGEIKQCNEGKWTFSFDEETKKGYVLLDVGVQKHLSSSLIDVDVHPDYVSVVIKSKVLRLVLPAEVASGEATAMRSKTTGHLVVSMKKVDPKENMVALRAARKHAENKVNEEIKKKEDEQANRENRKLGALAQAVGAQALAGPVSIKGIVRGKGAEANKTAGADIGLVAKTTSRNATAAGKAGGGGGDDDDDDEPPPIF